MLFSIRYDPKLFLLLGLSNISFNNKSILLQYLSLYSPYLSSIIFSPCYSKTLLERVQKAPNFVQK